MPIIAEKQFSDLFNYIGKSMMGIRLGKKKNDPYWISDEVVENMLKKIEYFSLEVLNEIKKYPINKDNVIK